MWADRMTPLHVLRRARLALSVVAFALALPACAMDAGTPQAAQSRAAPKGTPSMHTATAEDSSALARATFTIVRDGEGGRLRVAYTVHNTSSGWLYVFDRGDTHAVSTKRQRLGDIAPPHEGATAEGTTLTHAPKPIGTPSPTAPPIPLASAIAPGARHAAEFFYTVPRDRGAAPLRYCVTIAPAGTRVGEALPGSEVYRVDGAFGLERTTLCSPWFDSDAAAFRDR